MGSEAANILASAAKSLEVDRSPNATQRASEIAQEQLAGESVAAIGRKRPDAVDRLRRDKIRQDRERRRRELERRENQEDTENPLDERGGHTLDVVA